MNKKQKKVAVGVGVGLTALAAAAAAGTYFFAGKRGAKNRAKVSKWSEAAKNDVVKQVKGLKKVTEKTYGEAVDAVITQYKKAKKMDPNELAALASELKGHWESIASEVSGAAKKVTPVIKKAVKKVQTVVAKPAAKKAPAKTVKTAAKKRL